MQREARAHRVGAGTRGRALSVMVCFASVLIVTSSLACAKPAEVILHAFAGPPGDGASPDARVVMDTAGNLYGTTYYGGAYNLGTVYKLASSGHEKVLHDFDGTDGLAPTGGVIIGDKGNLYGTAWAGGKNEQDCNSDGCGVVFRLKPDGAFKMLYAFTGGAADGDAPDAGLLERQHTLFGTTYYGGANKEGTAFALTPAGSETLIFSFDQFGGSNPTSELIMDKSGNLYGTTEFGGSSGRGCVYELAQDGTETALYSFGGSDSPTGGLLMDKAGNLYGTSSSGYNQGAVYKIAPDGTETFLYALGGVPAGTLIADKKGNLYGSTWNGGVIDYNCDPWGCGTVFEIKTDGTERVLYAFQGGTDGAGPSDLTMDSAGNLYGTTYYGGTGSGTVFEIIP